MSGSSLIVTNHSDDIEILTGVHLIISLHLLGGVDDTLADILERHSGYGVCYGAVTRGFLETNGIIEARQVASPGTHLKFLKVE